MNGFDDGESADLKSAGEVSPAESREGFSPSRQVVRPMEPQLARKGIPEDLTCLFMILALVWVLTPLLARKKLDHCANDASRWNTIYYLVEDGTYEWLPEWTMEGRAPSRIHASEIPAGAKTPPIQVGEWYYHSPFDIGPFWTIDMIRVDGKYMSSKPPFLPTCLAGFVWCLERITQKDFTTNPRFIMRTTVICCQVVPFMIMIWLIRGHVIRFADSAFARNLSIAIAALATYLTPYVIPLNNHVIAACTAMFALHAAIRIWYDGRREWYWFAMAGFFAALTATFELPAGLFAMILFVALLVKDFRKTLLVGLPIALLPALAGVTTNYIAIGRIMPAYTDVDKVGGVYDYPGSYWDPQDVNPHCPAGVDHLNERKGVFLLHALIGHHGWFLLTPVFLLSLIGIGWHLFHRGERSYPMLALLTLSLPLAVIVAYMFRRHLSYGGVCQGLRWLFWLIPMWLLMLPRGADLLARHKAGRALCYILVAVSLLSVAWAMPQTGEVLDHTDRPFNESWAHEFMKSHGWVNY